MKYVEYVKGQTLARRFIVEGVTHGAAFSGDLKGSYGDSMDEVSWCGFIGPWNDGLFAPKTRAVWAADPVTCLECIALGGSNG